MQLDRFTIKSQDALQQAIRLAADRRNTEAAPQHLLLALLDQQEGIVGPVLRKVGTDPAAIRSEVGGKLDSLPTITAGAREPATSRELLDVLRAAEREAGEDVRGPCDEAEHATDPRCTGAALAGDDDNHDNDDDDHRGRGRGGDDDD